MIYIFLISIIAIPCLATGPSPSLPDDNSTSSVGPITRWIELHKRIFSNSSSSKINLSELTTLIKEMSEIEQSEPYKLGLKPLIESGRYQVKAYKQLVEQFYASNILTRQDLTVTDLLMQLFEYNSNDCTAEYFQQLDLIQETFKNSSLANALEESRQLQYKNCWARLMVPVVASNNIVGSRVRDHLNMLVSAIYPKNTTKLVTLSSEHKTPEYHNQSEEIVAKIGQFLRDKLPIDSNYDPRDFRHLIQHPCANLIETTRQYMLKIWKLLEFAGEKRDFITNEHALILNKYMLCERILADKDFILSSLTSQAKTKRPFPIDLNLTSDENYGEHLITQHPMFGSAGDDDDDDDDRDDDNGDKLNVADYKSAEKRPKIGQRVVCIEKGLGRAKNIRYPTLWSDGTTTMESRAYLVENWRDELDILLKRQAAESQAEYARRRTAKRNAKTANLRDLNELGPNKRPQDYSHIVLDLTTEQLDSMQANQGYCSSNKIQEDVGQKRIVKIDAAVGRGRHIEYPTYWSDGSITMEKKKFIMDNAFAVWYDYTQNQRAKHQATYEAKTAAKNMVNFDESRPFRARIPILARQKEPTTEQPFVFSTVLDSLDLHSNNQSETNPNLLDQHEHQNDANQGLNLQLDLPSHPKTRRSNKPRKSRKNKNIF